MREDRTGEIFWFSTDLNGALLEATDVEGNLRWSGHYGSFGEVRYQTDGFMRLAQSPALAYQPLRYAGQHANSETGLHYNLFRYRDHEADPVFNYAEVVSGMTKVANTFEEFIGLLESRYEEVDMSGVVKIDLDF
nr:RHS domain-containing protein [Cronobacter turicensis]